jgi:hypothetical protein
VSSDGAAFGREAGQGSGRPGAGALIAGGGHCVAAVETGSGGVGLVEPVGPQRLADLGGQIGLFPAHRWPHRQAGTPPQALDRPGQQRRPLEVTLANASWANAARTRVTFWVL